MSTCGAYDVKGVLNIQILSPWNRVIKYFMKYQKIFKIYLKKTKKTPLYILIIDVSFNLFSLTACISSAAIITKVINYFITQVLKKSTPRLINIKSHVSSSNKIEEIAF